MRTALDHAINMLPYMLIAAPLYILARLIYVKCRHQAVQWPKEIAMLLFVLFTVGLASQTLIPKFEFGVNGLSIVQDGAHRTNLIPFKVFYDTVVEVFVHRNLSYFLINFLGNIMIFMPFGFFLPLLWQTSRTTTILIGAGASLVIELGQLFLARGTDIDDLLLNTLGVFLGWLVFHVFHTHRHKKSSL